MIRQTVTNRLPLFTGGILMTNDIAIVFAVMTLAIILFTTDKLRTDLVAILIMLVLPWTGVISVREAFSGLSSNAVVSVMAVMVLGYGIERSGAMNPMADKIVKKAGKDGRVIMAMITATVGVISSFMQNIGAVALFLPAVKKISKETRLNPKKVLIPLGYGGILGGTITMVASGPLIILNDLLREGGYDAYGLFSVSPVGLALLISGILYFYFLYEKVLPDTKIEETKARKIPDIYDLPKEIHEFVVPKGSELIGSSIEELQLWRRFKIHFLAVSDSGSIVYVPWRQTRFSEGQSVAILGREGNIQCFFKQFGLEKLDRPKVFKDLEDEEKAGFAEIILPPGSSIKDKMLEEIAVRKNFKVEPIFYMDTDGETFEFIEKPLEPGMKVIVFGRWQDIRTLKESKDFIVISEVKPPIDEIDDKKRMWSLGVLVLSIVLIMMGFPLPLSFFSGAFVMVMLNIVPKEELYKAIDWKTVFLLAGLIPLGVAFEKTGAAKLLADLTVEMVWGWNSYLILLVIGIIASLFSLFMSNVAATVLLVPLVMIMANGFGIDPRGAALLVAVCASNSFVIPTHQVNAYIMGPGGYNTKDYIRAGGGLSILFLFVATTVIYLLYL